MGGFPIPPAKNRKKIIEHRKRYERDIKKRVQHQQSSSQAMSSVQCHSMNVPATLEVKILRSCPGIQIVECEKDGVNYTGVLYAQNNGDGSPGIIRDDLTRFKKNVESFIDVSAIDQWTSVVGDRLLTSGIQLRDRFSMRTFGRMICAGCMGAIPDNELIPRRSFINPNRRRVLLVPKNTSQVVARIDESTCGSQMNHEICYESANEDHGNETEEECSSDASANSVPLLKRNKRKSYIPRGACSVLVPAGVDLFEPEYDPLPSSSSSVPDTDPSCEPCTIRQAHKLIKHVQLTSLEASLHKSKSKTQHVNMNSDKFNSIRCKFAGMTTDNRNIIQNQQSNGQAMASAIRFRSDKIRDAFSSKYTIRKSGEDSLHMTFIRQPSDASNPSSGLRTGTNLDLKIGRATAHVREGAPLLMATKLMMKADHLSNTCRESADLPLKTSNDKGNHEELFDVDVSNHVATPKHSSSDTADNSSSHVKSRTENDGPNDGDRSSGAGHSKSNLPLKHSEKAENKLPKEKTTKATSVVSSTGCKNDAEMTANEIQNRPPIRIVLKSVKMDNQMSRKSSSDLPVKNKQTVANEKYIQNQPFGSLQRRSDTGCPPMSMNSVSHITLGVKKELESEEEKKKTQSWSKSPPSKKRCVKKRMRSVRVDVESELSSIDISDDEQVVNITKTENMLRLKIGEIVWAKNGTDAYWPGKVHGFRRHNKKYGASIVWLGVDTYSPFIEFARMERFVDSYENRFNPKRTEAKYHKAVAHGIVACLPINGYFERKLSPQVHRSLIQDHSINLGDVKIITKRKKRTSHAKILKKKKEIVGHGSMSVRTVIKQDFASENGSNVLNIGQCDTSNLEETDMNGETTDNSLQLVSLIDFFHLRFK